MTEDESDDEDPIFEEDVPVMVSQYTTNPWESIDSLTMCILQDPNWHEKFILPEKYTLGRTVARAIDTGVVTTTAKHRLITVIKGCVVVHTMTPEPHQVAAVTRALIAKFPSLRDHKGNGYVSNDCWQNTQLHLKHNYQSTRICNLDTIVSRYT